MSLTLTVHVFRDHNEIILYIGPLKGGIRKKNWHEVPLKNLYIWKLIWNSALIAQVWAFRNCLRQLYFKSKWRGIGYSFQLAITAPLYSITGYCIATAQSCQNRSRFHQFSILPRKPCWIQNITLHDAVWELTLGSNVKSIADEQPLHRGFEHMAMGFASRWARKVKLPQCDQLPSPTNVFCTLICLCQMMFQLWT